MGHLLTFASAEIVNGLIVGTMLLLMAGRASAEVVWPTVELPKEVRAYRVGEQLIVNGLPMRIQAFVSTVAPAVILESFRRSIGKPAVESRLANKLVLGRPQGEYFISVQLEPWGRGTRGLLAVSHLKAGFDTRFETKLARERWLDRLPSGSQLISHLVSTDGGKLAQYLVVSNTYHEDLNRDRLISMMGEDGLTLEREALAATVPNRTLPAAIANGKTLFFKGAGKEAIAVIRRDEAGHSIVVLNTTTAMERFR